MDLVVNMKVKDSLGCCDHKMVKFRILRAGTVVKRKVTALDFGKADFGLFKNPCGRVSWVKDLGKGKRILGSWLILKSCFLIPMNRKSDRNARSPAWILGKVKHRNQEQGGQKKR